MNGFCMKCITVLKWIIASFYKDYHCVKKCPYSKFFWFVFSHIWTEYGETGSISTYSFRMRENTDQTKSEYGHFSHCVSLSENIFWSIYSICKSSCCWKELSDDRKDKLYFMRHSNFFLVSISYRKFQTMSVCPLGNTLSVE